jgi:hypothetical protein
MMFVHKIISYPGKLPADYSTNRGQTLVEF